MLKIAAWAVLAITPLAHGHFARFRLHNDTQCCPCATGGVPLSRNGTAATATVTVTVLELQKTVTVDHTVTEHETTIFVAQTSTPTAPAVVTQQLKNQPQLPPPRKVITVVDEFQSVKQTLQTVTQLVQPWDNGSQNPKTITVTVGASDSNSAATNLAESLPAATSNPEVVTVTIHPQPVAAGPSRPDSSHDAIIKTLSPAGPPKVKEIQTVFVSAEPSIDIVAFVDSTPSTKDKSAPQAATTVAPQVETVVSNIDHFTTLTKTVSSAGVDNIEIIIININTGETTCRKKQSGKPCTPEPHTRALNSSSHSCPSTGLSTRTATAFNTVVVTISQNRWWNGTAPTGIPKPSGSNAPMVRSSRASLFK